LRKASEKWTFQLIFNPMFNFIRKESESFRNALNGLAPAVKQRHFRIHLFATAAVVLLGFMLKIERGEWIAILICIGLVMMAEALNTSLEILADKIHPEQHPEIAKVKDVAALAVLIVSVISAIIGLMIFIPFLI